VHGLAYFLVCGGEGKEGRDGEVCGDGYEDEFARYQVVERSGAERGRRIIGIGGHGRLGAGCAGVRRGLGRGGMSAGHDGHARERGSVISVRKRFGSTASSAVVNMVWGMGADRFVWEILLFTKRQK
jgi:hypothetical protein